MACQPLNLTHTQRVILNEAQGHERGLVRMGAGDRKGTRRAGWDSMGVPIVIAYSEPEFFLKGRGFLRSYGNDRHVYQITDAGLDAMARTKTLGKPHVRRTVR